MPGRPIPAMLPRLTEGSRVPPPAAFTQSAPAADSADPFRSPASGRDERVSQAIRIARVICIMGIVYIHGWTGRNGNDLNLLNHTPQGFMRWALIELFARSAVPLLSIISGWLVAPSLLRQGTNAFLAGKLRAILLPMVAWNALAIVLVSGAATMGWLYAPRPTSWWWLIDELFCLVTPDDINVQMSFLRDLFLCMLAVPWLARQSVGTLGMVLGAAVIWALLPVSIPVLLRPSILVFFLVGLLVRRHGLAAWLALRPLPLVAGTYAMVAALRIWLEVAEVHVVTDTPVLMNAVDLVMRCSTAMFFWAIAWRLAGGRGAPPLSRIEPYMFLMFCAHLIMIWLTGPLIGHVTGPIGTPFYPIFLLFQPVLILVATMALGRVLMRFTPRAARFLSGGRLHR